MITIFSSISRWLDDLVADRVKLYLYDKRAYHRTSLSGLFFGAMIVILLQAIIFSIWWLFR